jgi:hypothetical protein
MAVKHILLVAFSAAIWALPQETAKSELAGGSGYDYVSNALDSADVEFV